MKTILSTSSSNLAQFVPEKFHSHRILIFSIEINAIMGKHLSGIWWQNILGSYDKYDGAEIERELHVTTNGQIRDTYP